MDNEIISNSVVESHNSGNLPKNEVNSKYTDKCEQPLKTHESVICDDLKAVKTSEDDGDLKTALIAKYESELSALRTRICEFEELERTQREKSAFYEFFPEINYDQIPDEVFELSKNLPSLAASFALYNRKNELMQKLQNQENEKISQSHTSALILDGDFEPDEFSQEEIARMSRSDIRRNYSKILRSLTKNKQNI